MATVLNGAQFLTISADQTASLRGPDRRAAIARLGAGFLMDGSVVREGDVLRAHVRLDDVRAGATVWSNSFSGPSSDPVALETDVASKATDIALFARNARLGPGGNIDAALLAEYLKASDLILNAGLRPDGGGASARVLLEQVVAQAPNFARGQGSLALAAGLASRRASPEQHDQLVREAREHAVATSRLDPRSGEPYLALYEIPPARNWADRERIMLQGLSVEPDFPFLVSTRSVFLANVGRTQEAIAAAQRALAGDAVHPRTNYRYAITLSNAGQVGAARTAADQTFRVQPASWTDLARLSLVMIYGSTQEARLLLDRSNAHPYTGEAPALAAWSAYLKARESGRAADRADAVTAIERSVEQGDLAVRDAIFALCVLGDRDAAFAQFAFVERALETAATDFLFAPATAPLRSDPRFWSFAERTGMVRYWQSTGHWPDVCAGRAARADCEARASAAAVAARN